MTLNFIVRLRWGHLSMTSLNRGDMTEVRKNKNDHVGGREEAKEGSTQVDKASKVDYSMSYPVRCQSFRIEDSSTTLTRATIITR